MASSLYVSHGENPRLNTVRSRLFNADNGNGTTVDDCILRPAGAITLKAARVVYTTETTGTIAAATIQLGVAVAGATVIAATALENSKAIGTTTALTLLLTAVAAGTPLIARHTGVASTAAGEYYLEVDFVYDD